MSKKIIKTPTPVNQGKAVGKKLTTGTDKIPKSAIAMLKKLCGSDNEDLRYIAFMFTNGNVLRKQEMHNHYCINGTELINAVFRGESKKAIELASDNDAQLLKSIK